MTQRWTVLEILQWTAGYFKEQGIDGGRLDAEVLLADTLGLDRVGLYLNYDRPLNPSELTDFRQRVKRRALREPVQYILGKTEFWSIPLQVTPDVLIPRPDTEVLVEEALNRASGCCSILDVGTGSGAIAIALAHELSESRVTAVDISEGALQVAGNNSRANGVADRVALCHGDLYRLPEGPYDLVVSNPPYIPKLDVEGLMPEVRDFEPQLALCGGEDGLDCYRALAAQAPTILGPGGWLLVEVGIAQAEDVRKLLEEAGLTETCIRDDYSGIPRVVGGRRPLA